MKKLCVFDLDGTLIDSIGDISEAVNYALRQMGKTEHPKDSYYHMVGNGMELLCRRALPDGTEDEIQELISLYKNRYIENCCVKTKPYQGITEFLKRLHSRGIKLALLSNKPKTQVDEVVSKLFGTELFYAVMGQNDRFPIKPDPAALDYLIARAELQKEEVWYIGDSDVDIELGKRSGVDAIGVSWGFRGRGELEAAGAEYIADTVNELEKIILS